MTPAIAGEYRLSTEAKLKGFVTAILTAVGVERSDAVTVGDVLVAADLRGVESHGVARLGSYYVSRIRSGRLAPRAEVTTVRETPTSIVLDAGNGLGHPAGKRAMEAVIAKARQSGAAFGAVRNSNHYGIAGYYAMLALPHDLIGISSTNSVRYGAPTYGKTIMLGTNPWAYAIPADREPAFVLDFATTTVPRGKLEVYKRKEKQLNSGWAIDADGNETRDADQALRGALLPLGGFGVDGGGHKGYGLGLLVDIMCGVLSGGAFGNELPLPSDGPLPGKISHFFGALDINGFRDVARFKRDMDRELRAFKDSQKVPGQERIYVAGEIEYEKTLAHRENGVPVHAKVWAELETLASELNVPFDIAR
ncbi:MAG: Ldh family oxidoreductase [Candidatus Eremiobacteraeota bacterium]|nr:Ldh family oxidoreductase [Candidatus Eremiobacteraeota bacterium]MBC5802103.1 Ldh family oxidoreductase [Candidatus Eremiobacteraeota bacterium]MBC5824319.1 Ldh family oxidoreductase [Candidatus Eremiobacteraeota bacterium]